MTRVGAAARAAGIAAGVLVWNPEDVGRYVTEGFTFFSITSEANILDRALRRELDSARRGSARVATPEVP